MSETATDRVADAPSDNWVYRFLPQSLWPYAQLARWDRPIGWWLLLWPCWWSLILAVHILTTDPAFRESAVSFLGPQIFVLLLLFFVGTVSMRGAGCTYNDWVDSDIDLKVARTASRPIPSGRVSSFQILIFLAVQAFIGLMVLIGVSRVAFDGFNTEVFFVGVLSLIIVAAYPFAKRITNWPQMVLGLAFSWGAIMGWISIHGVSAPTALAFDQTVLARLAPALFLYAGSVLWVIGYDTIYAHQDKEDDAIIGVKSTARLFGEKTRPALIILYFGTLVLFAIAFALAQASWPCYFGLAIGCGHMIWQIGSLNISDPDNCLALFKSNKTFGWIIFAGLVAGLFV